MQTTAVWLALALALAACDRPAPKGPAPGKRSAVSRTPRTRSTAMVTPPAAPVEALPGDMGRNVTVSLIAGGHVLDCRAEAYHPAMQTAVGTTSAVFRCSANGEGLVLSAYSERVNAPAVSVATISDGDDGVELRWDDGVNTMDCAPAASFEALRHAACGLDNELALTGCAVRRTWRQE